MGFTVREARLQDLSNRQNSVETTDENLAVKWKNLQTDVTKVCGDFYNWAIENGIAKEQARAILPEGLILSRMYMAGSLRSWIHYCQLRSGVETQKEHREIAIDAWNQITEQFPSLKDALEL
jgi:thymidylate synthase (FAD)